MRSALLANWKLKIVSVALATALWALVASSASSRATVTARVEVVGLAPDLVVVAGLPERIELDVEAPRLTAARLRAEGLELRIDLAGAAAGETVVLLSAENAHVPAGVTVTRVRPGAVRVTAVPLATRVADRDADVPSGVGPERNPAAPASGR